MSLKFNKQFSVFVRGMNNNKLSFLLQQFGLTSRIVSDSSQLEMILDEKIDYSKVNGIIDKERSNAINYLESNLK